MADVFLSYRNLPDRRSFVERLAAILEAHGLIVWWDYGLEAGDAYREQILHELAKAKVVAPLWCSQSVKSEWVLKEADLGRAKLLPARMQTIRPPAAFETIQAADLTAWDGGVDHEPLVRYVARVATKSNTVLRQSLSLIGQLRLLPPLSPLSDDGLQNRTNLSVAARVRAQLGDEPDLVDLQHFIDSFPGTQEAFDARRLHDALEAKATAFEAACRANTVKALNAFLRRYPAARQASSAARLIQDLVESEFRKAISSSTQHAIEAFLRDHPNAPQASQAVARLEELRLAELARVEAGKLANLFQFARTSSKPRAAIADLLRQHPNGPHTAEATQLLATLPADPNLIAELRPAEWARLNLDGSLIATAGRDSFAHVWDVSSGRKTADFPVTGDVWLSRDSTYVIGTQNRDLTIWDLATRVKVAALGFDKVFDASNRCIIIGGSSTVTRVVDLRSGREIVRLNGYNVSHASFAADEKRIVTMVGYSSSQLWDADRGRVIAEVKDADNTFLKPTISPDGTRVMMPGFETGPRLLDARSGKPIATLATTKKRSLMDASFSPDGKLIVIASDDGSAFVFDSERGREVARMGGHLDGIWSASFARDAKFVVTASEDHTARVWESSSGREVSVFRGHHDVVRGASFSPNGASVVSHTTKEPGVRVWEAASGREIAILQGHEKGAWLSTFAAAGRRIVTGSGGAVRIWETARQS